MTTLAITGATGNLGGLVIDHLLASGINPTDLIPLVRTTKKGQPFTDRGMSPRVASYDDPEGFVQAITGLDKLVLISPPSLDNAERLHQLHGVVMAAHTSGISHLIYVGLSDPEERPFGLEDVELAIEHSIRASGIPFTFLRNSVYLDELGPELAVAAHSGELISATQNHPMNWALRSDQAAAIAVVAAADPQDHLGATYDLVSSAPYTYDDLAGMLTQATERQITHRTAPPAQAITDLTKAGMDAQHAMNMVEYFHAAIATDKCHTTGNDIQRLTGRSSRPTEQYLATLLERATTTH